MFLTPLISKHRPTPEQLEKLAEVLKKEFCPTTLPKKDLDPCNSPREGLSDPELKPLAPEQPTVDEQPLTYNTQTARALPPNTFGCVLNRRGFWWTDTGVTANRAEANWFSVECFLRTAGPYDSFEVAPELVPVVADENSSAPQPEPVEDVVETPAVEADADLVKFLNDLQKALQVPSTTDIHRGMDRTINDVIFRLTNILRDRAEARKAEDEVAKSGAGGSSPLDEDASFLLAAYDKAKSLVTSDDVTLVETIAGADTLHGSEYTVTVRIEKDSE